VFLDAIVVNVRDGQVTNRPVYAAIGVTLEGCKDILGLWAGTGGEGAKFWMSVLTDIRNRGVRGFISTADAPLFTPATPAAAHHPGPNGVSQSRDHAIRALAGLAGTGTAAKGRAGRHAAPGIMMACARWSSWAGAARASQPCPGSSAT
jgi:Transposase, Mutator family